MLRILETESICDFTDIGISRDKPVLRLSNKAQRDKILGSAASLPLDKIAEVTRRKIGHVGEIGNFRNLIEQPPTCKTVFQRFLEISHHG